jgi:phosphoglycolate phosphatase
MKSLAILFDLDGTLIDTAPDLAFALNTLLIEDGCKPKTLDELKPWVAFGGKALIKQGFGIELTHPDMVKKHQKFLQIYTQNIHKYSQLFAGMSEVIKRLKKQNTAWGIVTNKPENLTHLLLEKMQIKPDVVVCGDTLEFNKPHPAPLLYACAKLAVLPKHTLFVGDDKNDMLAGENAGIKTVAVQYGYGKINDSWHQTYTIKHPKELEKWL